MLLKCGIEIRSATTWLRNWAMAMWEVANGKILDLLFTNCDRKL